MTFSVFSPLNGGASDTYGYPSESPFDFDASLDFTRPKNGLAKNGYPQLIGYIDGYVPLMDSLIFAAAIADSPVGPVITQQTIQGSPMQMVWPNWMGSIKKVNG